ADGGPRKARSTEDPRRRGTTPRSHAPYIAASRTAWGACRRRTSHHGQHPRTGLAHPPCRGISKISNFSREVPPHLGCPMEVSAPPRPHEAPPISEIHSRRPWSSRDTPEILSAPQEEAYLDSLGAEAGAGVLHSSPANLAKVANLEVTPGVHHVR